ncbi:MAG: Ig-like domain-containing protein [bacterium]|nr:Ig-like domain-containing protein [bacterium]
MPEDQANTTNEAALEEKISSETLASSEKLGLKKRVKNWISSHRKLSLAIGLGVFLILFSTTALAYLKLNQPKTLKVGSKSVVNEFLLLQTDPINDAVGVAVNKKISFVFNQEVRLHDFEHNFSISPEVEGTFSLSASEKQVTFIPQETLLDTTSYSITISDQLRSKAGQALISTYYLVFSTDLSSNEVFFSEKDEDLVTKLLSFSSTRGSTLTVRVGKGFSDVNLNLYKADLDTLLNSFVYRAKKDIGGTNYLDYANKLVNSEKLEKLSSKEKVKDKENYFVKEEKGIYFLEAVNDGGDRVGQIWLVSNSKGLIFRQDDQKILLAGQDLDGNVLTQPIEVDFYSMLDKPTIINSAEVTDQKEISFIYPKKVDLVVGKTQGEVLIVPVAILLSQADIRVRSNLSENNEIFLYTDRPIYKKGDKIRYRGLVRKDNDAIYKMPGSQTVRVSVKSYDSKTESEKVVFQKDQTTNSGGIFSGELIAAEGTGPLTAEVLGETKENYSEASVYYEVLDYKKPNFDLTVELDKGEYLLKDKIQATIRGKYNNGTPLAKTKVNYGYVTSSYFETDKAVYNQNFNLNSWGGMCGGGFQEDQYFDSINQDSPEVTLDAKGTATVTVNTNEFKTNSSQNVTVVAIKTDENKNRIFGAGKGIVHQGNANLFIRPIKWAYLKGENLVASFYSETREGVKQGNKTFNYTISSVSYDNKTYESVEKVEISGSTKTDNNGIGIIKQKLEVQEKNSSYILRVKGTDGSGNYIDDSKSLYISDEPRGFTFFSDQNLTKLSVTAEKNSYLVGDTANLQIEVPEDIKALVTTERGRIYSSEWKEIKKGKSIFPLEINEELSPSFSLVFTFFKDGKYYSEGLSLNVPAMHKLVKVEIKTDKDQYKPSEKAKLTITTKDNSGNPIAAKISLSLVDKSIYILRKSALPAIHSSFYYFRGRSTNASSSLIKIGDYGGGGGGGGGGITADKLVDTLYWNPNLETNSSGTLTLVVPLSTYETTWKAAVYASTNTTQVGQNDLDFTVSK